MWVVLKHHMKFKEKKRNFCERPAEAEMSSTWLKSFRGRHSVGGRAWSAFV